MRFWRRLSRSDINNSQTRLINGPDDPASSSSSNFGSSSCALQPGFALTLATARSWDGTYPVSEGLQARGVLIAGAVLEDGALLHLPGQAPPSTPPQPSREPSREPRAAEGAQVPPGARPLESGRDWNGLRSQIEARRQGWWPAFEWQRDFVACLVARARSSEQAALLMEAWAPLGGELNAQGHALRLFRDGRKLYVAGQKADKWAALQHLLGPNAQHSAGVGDGANDVCWLSRIALPCTLSHAAPQVLAAVRERGGFVSRRAGHAGIADVLSFLLQAHGPANREPGVP